MPASHEEHSLPSAKERSKDGIVPPGQAEHVGRPGCATQPDGQTRHRVLLGSFDDRKELTGQILHSVVFDAF